MQLLQRVNLTKHLNREVKDWVRQDRMRLVIPLGNVRESVGVLAGFEPEFKSTLILKPSL